MGLSDIKLTIRYRWYTRPLVFCVEKPLKAAVYLGLVSPHRAAVILLNIYRHCVLINSPKSV